ncbi:uncharacterized protein [Fopius arisanus]|uniref:Uncharacterized protein n=1 Tax=Fopius arisanus TaxID=64838 RepID=A0A9R1UAS7_9HYME|nr:PREDICTED: uncharacterized protein LOC105273205 [Fopius arisanus]
MVLPTSVSKMSNVVGNEDFESPGEISWHHSLKRMLKSQTIEAEDINDEETLTQEDLAPEGGWGWMVALGLTIIFTVIFSAVPCVPILFGELLEASGSPGSSMTILNTIWTLSWSISGLCTNVLLKKFPMRLIGVSGALVYSASWMMSAVVMNVYQLGITFFVQGVGLGIMATICQSNFNAYFVKRRATVTSATQIIMSLFGVLYPIMIGEMMKAFGYRGTVALIGALSLNSIFGMLLMHPVEQYLKNPKDVIAARRAKNHRKLSQAKMKIGDSSQDIRIKTPINNETKLNMEPSRWSSLGNLEEGSHLALLSETLKEKVASSSDVALIRDPRSRVNSISRTPVRGPSVLSSPSSSIANLGAAVAEMQLRKKTPPKNAADIQPDKSMMMLKEKKNFIAGTSEIVKTTEDQGAIEMIMELFDLSILKDCTFITMCLGVSFAITSDVIFVTLLPLAMFNSGYSTVNAAYAVAISCAAEFFCKIALTIMTMFIDVRAKTLVFLAMIAMAVVKIAYFNLESSLMGIMVSMVLVGTVRVCLFVPQSLVIVENYPVHKHAACYGIYSMISGLTFIIANPIFGLIKDLTGSFSVCQLALIALNCAFILPWGIELAAYYRNRRKQEVANPAN